MAEQDILNELKKAAQLGGVWGKLRWRQAIEAIVRIPDAQELRP